MSVENIIEELDNSSEGGLKKTRVRKGKKSVDSAVGAGNKKKFSKPDMKLFALVVVFIGIIGGVGLVFGYTKDQAGTDAGVKVSNGLEAQLNNLKDELNALREKTTVLERENSANKDIMLDLFEQSRKIPTVTAENWVPVTDESLTFNIKTPATWEKVKSIIEKPAVAPDAAVDGAVPAEATPTIVVEDESIYLQPIGQSDFLNAILIETDYPEYIDKTLAEKAAAFSKLDLLDKIDFAGGQMLYFVNIDKNNIQVPTILILTKEKIYRATFNVSNKKLEKYTDHRKEFEEIISTFELK